MIIGMVRTSKVGVFTFPCPTLSKGDERRIEIFSYHPFSKEKERIEVEVIE
jgi:hypothetical protein